MIFFSKNKFYNYSRLKIDRNIYDYYLYILAYNQYKYSYGSKSFAKMNIDYELKMEDCELSLITAISPF